jgi:transcriptional regulator with XRE-family HTH domain
MMKSKYIFSSRDGVRCSEISKLAAVNIQCVMRERRISLSQLAKQSGLSKGSLSTYFHDKRTLTLRSLEKISIALNLMPYVFIQDVGLHRTGRRRRVWWGKVKEALNVKISLEKKEFLDSINEEKLSRIGKIKFEAEIKKQRFKEGINRYDQ